VKFLSKEEITALLYLARRQNPSCKRWNYYVHGNWMCNICHKTTADEAAHGRQHLKEKSLLAFM
jgi:hypothetical protein